MGSSGAKYIRLTQTVIEHIWTPPNAGERILATCEYEGVIIIVTTHATYMLREESQEIPPKFVVEMVKPLDPELK